MSKRSGTWPTMGGCSNILQCRFWGPGLSTLISAWRQLSWFWCNLCKRGEEEEWSSMVLSGRLGPHWLSSGNPPLWEESTWLCPLGRSSVILSPLAAPVKGDSINISRQEFVHGWETSSHKIGHILLRFSLPFLKCTKRSGRCIMFKCHLSRSAHACSF